MKSCAPDSTRGILTESTNWWELKMNLFTDLQHIALLRHIGTAAFVFFLVKGVLWLAAPFVFLYFL